MGKTNPCAPTIRPVVSCERCEVPCGALPRAGDVGLGVLQRAIGWRGPEDGPVDDRLYWGRGHKWLGASSLLFATGGTPCDEQRHSAAVRATGFWWWFAPTAVGAAASRGSGFVFRKPRIVEHASGACARLGCTWRHVMDSSQLQRATSQRGTATSSSNPSCMFQCFTRQSWGKEAAQAASVHGADARTIFLSPRSWGE